LSSDFNLNHLTHIILIKPQLYHFTFLLIIIASSCNPSNHPEHKLTDDDLSPTELAGKKMFEANCVRCHGMDGSGLTGPSLKRPRLKRAADAASFTTIVQNGIMGTGMPGNWSITDTEGHQLYAYINFIKNQDKESITGDPVAGKIVYDHSNCNTCHVMQGEGISIGPELTEIGSSRNATYLRQAITEPEATLPESTDFDNGYGFSLYLPVKIKTLDNTEITGLRINEDTYTIQVKDASNNYYSFFKDKIASIEKLYGHSIMPSYKSRLSATEIENLVAYLSKSGNQ
jgi:putative heme-binding domain-containing protein